MHEQQFIYPADLFNAGGVSLPAWTCARTRPRWEKRFAQWLRVGNFDYFLPVISKRVCSQRKVRTTELPLFPGYVFVRGTLPKQVFSRSSAVVYVLHPRSPQEEQDVNNTLASVWRMLAEGRDVTPVDWLKPGEEVEVIAGPLQGTRGRFVREGAGGKLVVWIDLLGGGVSAVIEDATLVERVA